MDEQTVEAAEPCSMLCLPMELIVDILDRLPLSSWSALANTCRHTACIIQTYMLSHTDKLDVIRLMRPLKLHTIILKTWKNEFFHTDILTQVIIQSPERAINILDRLSLTRADVLSGNKVTLRNCVKYGRVDILKHLVEQHRLSKEYFKKLGIQPFFVCVLGNHFDMIKYLCEQLQLTGAHVRGKGNLALHEACFHGRLDIVQYFMGPGGLKVSDLRSFNYQALHKASSNGHLDVVCYLLDLCNLNNQTHTALTCWMKLIEFCVSKNDGMDLLTRVAVCVNLPTQENLTFNNLLQRLVIYLEFSVSAKHKIFTMAAKSGNLGVVNMFVECLQFTKKEICLNDYYALRASATCGHTVVTQYLIQKAELIDNRWCR